MNAHELHERIGRRGREPIAVLDVRERAEFGSGQVPHSTPLPRGSLELIAPLALPARTLRVVLVSTRGERAAMAAETLLAMGFTQVHRLDGGLDAWRAAGLPLATGWGVDGKRVGEEIAHAAPDLQVDAGELAAWQAQGRVTLLDVRPRWEHAQGHVPGAWSVPAAELPRHLMRLKKLVQRDPAQRIVTHCAGRTRGLAAAELLRRAGIGRAHALRNGIIGWLLAGGTLAYDAARVAPRQPAADAAAADLPPATPVSAAALREHMRAHPGSFYLVDVRREAGYAAGHIAGALPLPAGQVLLEWERVLAVQALPVVLVADDAVSAPWSAQQLRAIGFAHVGVLEGGIDGWRACGGTCVRSSPLAPPAGDAGDAAIERVAPAQWAAAPHGWQLVDVRSAGEWSIGHLRGSTSLPRGLLERRLDDVRAAAAPLLLVSARGHRARLAARTLHTLGVARVAVLEGGLAAARAAGAPLAQSDVPEAPSRDNAGRIPAAVWQLPLERTRALMERYIAWEEALAAKPGAAA